MRNHEKTKALQQALTEARSLFADGFQHHDIPALAKLGLRVVQTVPGMTGSERKLFVLDFVHEGIERLDPPGPNWLYHQAADWFVPGMIDAAVDAARGRLGEIAS